MAIIAPRLPGAEGKKNGRPRPADRKVLNGIFFVLRTGTPWRDLPERYGPYTAGPTIASIVGPRRGSGCA
jgi:transposase